MSPASVAFVPFKVSTAQPVGHARMLAAFLLLAVGGKERDITSAERVTTTDEPPTFKRHNDLFVVITRVDYRSVRCEKG